MAKKILIVDDDKEDRELMESFLKKDGYEVVMAGDGAVALDLLGVNEVDVILLDIKMPTLSGYDFSRLLKWRSNKKIKIIYVSIVPRKEVDMGNVDGFIQKPFSSGVLLKTVKEVINKR